MAKKVGRQTFYCEKDISVLSFASVVGKKEHEGPLGDKFDVYSDDEFFGEETFEKAEIRMQTMAIDLALKKESFEEKDVDCIFAGDLLNQCVGSNYTARGRDVSFVGVYGACSTMALTLSLSTMMIEASAAKRAMAVTSSHFCSSERQFRFPLEYGGVRPQTSQWTVTGAGAVILGEGEEKPKIKAVTLGRTIDLGVKDMNNMGAAMAPAAADTIKAFLSDTKTKISDYDAVFTGDLGVVGSELLLELLQKDGIAPSNHNDCGVMIFDREKQDVHAGGSGCGCSASVLCSKILSDLENGKLKNILFCATGALMSPTSSLQGETIPSIAHLINIVGK